MSGPAVRAARAEDAPAAAELGRRREFSAAWGEEALRAELSREDSIFLVAEGGLGHALARAQARECRLLDLVAAEDGRGIGRALWAALAGEARRRGCSRVTLEVSEKNARARAFYAAAGARVVGRRRKFYNDGADAVLLDAPL